MKKDEITEKDLLKEVSEKLDKIMALLAAQGLTDKNDKIAILKKRGLSSEEIGEFVNVKNPRQMRGWKRK